MAMIIPVVNYGSLVHRDGGPAAYPPLAAEPDRLRSRAAVVLVEPVETDVQHRFTVP